MRIVAVQTGLSPNSVLGGTITDREFLTRLAERGVEIHVLARAGEPIIEHPNLIPHYWRPRVRIPRVPFLGNLDVAWDLRALLERIGPVDWIRFNSPSSVGLGTVLAGRRHRIWGSYLHCDGDHPFRRWVDTWLPKHCDLVTCLSEDTRRDVVARCPEADRPSTVVVPVGIDECRFAEARRNREAIRRELGVASEVVVLYVGSLIPRKGIAELVAAWERIGPRRDARLLIVGRPRAQLEGRLVAELVRRDDRVRHLEGVPYEKIPAYFGASDVFFFPTRLEGWGIVVGEAMAAGLPVVTTRAQGVREVVVADRTALVADVGNVDGLGSQLARLLDDPGLRSELGIGGQLRAHERFAWSGVIDRLLDLLAVRPVLARAAAMVA